MTDRPSAPEGDQSSENTGLPRPPERPVPESGRPAPSVPSPSGVEGAPAGLQPGADTPANPDPARNPHPTQPGQPGQYGQPNQQGSEPLQNLAEGVGNFAGTVGDAVTNAASTAYDAASHAVEQITPKQANALKIGALMGAVLTVATFFISLVTAAFTPVFEPLGYVVNSDDVGFFTRAGLQTNMALGGRLHLSVDAFGYYMRMSTGVLFFTGTLIAIALAFFVGRMLWKSSPIRGEGHLWMAAASMGVVSWMILNIVTLIAGTEIEDDVELGGSYLLTIPWIAIISIFTVFALAYTMGERNVSLLRFTQQHRAYWMPALALFVVVSLVATLFFGLSSIIGGVGSFGSNFAKFFLFVVTIVVMAVPMLFGALISSSHGRDTIGFPDESIWTLTSGLGKAPLLLGILVVLIGGIMVRQKLRGAGTSKQSIIADIVTFGVFGIVAMLALSVTIRAHELSARLGLGFGAVLINLLVGAAIVLVHAFLVPLLRKSAGGYARLEWKFMAMKLPNFIAAFTAVEAVPVPPAPAPAPAAPQGQPGQPGGGAQPAPVETTSASQPFYSDGNTVPAPPKPAPGEPAPSLPDETPEPKQGDDSGDDTRAQ